MFEAGTLYRANDPRVTSTIASYMTMAKWRVRGFGPRYIKMGKRVMFRGEDLNAWIEAQTIEPSGAPAAA